jgi:hemolysin activation/secretion protein
MVKRFTFTGNTLFSSEELEAVVADHRDMELTLSEIYALADRLTEFYQSKGYSLTTVTVPAQRMLDGILQFAVVEGRVGKLVFLENERYSESFLSRQLDLLAPGAILRFEDVENEVLLLNDLPGLLARSVLVPGEAYGTTDLHFKLEEKPLALRASLDNHGREVVGQWRAGVDLSLNNPFRFGDALSLGYTHTEDNLLRQIRVGYGLPIFTDGTRLNLNYSRAGYDVGGEFAALGIEGISATARLQVSRPYIRSRKVNLIGSLAAAHTKGQSDLGSVSLNDDEVSFVEAGFNYNQRNPGGGLGNISGTLATNFRDNPDGVHSNALPPRLELRGDYEHLFTQGWSLFLRGEGVLSFDHLPDSHKYGIGGPTSVRGFVSSTLRGDRGGMAGLEVRRLLPSSLADFQLRGFVEGGTVFHESGAESESLASAGLGAVAFFAGKYSLDLQWAAPIDGNDSGDGDGSRLWVLFSAMY